MGGRKGKEEIVLLNLKQIIVAKMNTVLKYFYLYFSLGRAKCSGSQSSRYFQKLKQICFRRKRRKRRKRKRRERKKDTVTSLSTGNTK